MEEKGMVSFESADLLQKAPLSATHDCASPDRADRFEVFDGGGHPLPVSGLETSECPLSHGLLPFESGPSASPSGGDRRITGDSG
jgi:hypothetical protein